MSRLIYSRGIAVAALISCSIQLSAQNMVLNPSFENYTSCPVGPSQFGNCMNWSEPFVNTVTDTCSTSDLYNSCSFLGCLGTGVPCNILGNEPARTGNGYAGVIAYEGFALLGCTSLFGSSWREYVQGQLSSPMIGGQTYCISFYVSLGDDVKFAVSDFGVYLSPNQLSINCTSVGASSALGPLGYSPQLQWTGGMLANESGWTRMQWSYTATGGERYITIGNFKGDGNTNYTCVDSAAFNPYAYYYIDDVEVVASNLCCPIITINSSSQNNVSCFGASDGSVSVAAINGAAPYTYSWSTGTTGATLSNQPVGSYRVTATDASGCAGIETIVITQPSVLTVNALSSASSCGTSATASPSGGTGPFSYLWSNGGTTATISNIPSGTYSVTVQDSRGCTASDSVNVTQSSGFTVSTSSVDPACGVCDGMVTATPSGGNPPYTYLWSNGQTSPTISSLCAGSYTVTVTEDTGSSGANIFWSEDFTSGGTGWTLNINGPGTNDANANQWIVNSASGCSACPASGSGGNYLHITCGSGIPCIGNEGDCTYDMGVPIFSNASTDKYVSSPNIPTIGKTGITLTFWYRSDGESGTDYGLVRLSNNGGANWTDLPTQYSATATCTQASISIPSPYENIADFRIAFRWVNNSNFNGNDPPFMIDDIELSAPSGSTACTATAMVSISSANSPAVTLDSKTDVACFGDANGAINITATGGSLPYSYSWTTGAITQNISGLNGGSYSVTVTDSTNCEGSLTADITEPSSALSIDTGVVTNAGCGNPTGAINLTVSGGNTPYAYSWSNGASSQSLSNIQAGDYVVTVSDNNLCVTTDSFTVNAPGSFSILLTTDSALCASSADGSMTTDITGGSAPFQYAWSTGATTNNITNVPKGVYSVTITDDNNCSVADTAAVGAPGTITAIASITEVLCHGGNDGAIKLIPSGGTPDYTALWSNGQSGLTLTELAPGIYTATVTDANGCVVDTQFNLTSASVYAVATTITNASCEGGTNGSAQANIISGTTPPYTYNWSNGDTTGTIANLSPGQYFVTVSDDLACLRKDTAVVGFGSGLMIEDSVKPVSCPEGEDGAIVVTVTGGTEPYIYSWSNNATSASNINIRAGTYFLTVTDRDDCTGFDTALVWVDSLGNAECDTLVIYEVFSPNGDGVNDEWVIDGLNIYTNNEIQIFNRWGNMVHEASPYGNDWDGRSKKGELLPAATYYYILKLNDSKQSVYSGSVTLIR